MAVVKERDADVMLLDFDNSDAGSHTSENEILGDDNDVESDNDDADSTEEELERLVFGDAAGFRAGLDRQSRSKKQVAVQTPEDASEETRTLETIADADLFMLDGGDDDAPDALALVPAEVSDSDSDASPEKEQTAWEDSDDGRISVSLMAVNRLRKLRRYEGEDMINGKEYIRRLRRQYEVLNPRPEWARQTTMRPRKKRRTSSDTGSDSSDAEFMDTDGEDASTQPLARLLQSGGSLTGSTRREGGSKKRKLRRDVIDIQRMKDLDVKDTVRHVPVIAMLQDTEIPTGTRRQFANPQLPPSHPHIKYKRKHLPPPSRLKPTKPQPSPHKRPREIRQRKRHLLLSILYRPSNLHLRVKQILQCMGLSIRPR